MNSLHERNLIEQGKELFNRGDLIKAVEVFGEVTELNPKNSDAYFYLANIFHTKGEIGKAIRAFNNVLKIDPENTDASISLSILYNDIGRYEEGKKIFDKTNERVKNSDLESKVEDRHVNKKFAAKHFELGELYVTYNRFDEALYEYNKAVSLNADNLDARIKVAKVYAQKGFKSKALDELKKLRNERPDFLAGRVALGVFYYGNGNILEAQAEWTKVLNKESGHSEAKMYMNLSQSASETSVLT